MIKTVFDILKEINDGNFVKLPEKIKIDGTLYIKVDDKDDPDFIYVDEDGDRFLNNLICDYNLQEILQCPVEEVKEKRWKPEKGEKYYRIDSLGNISGDYWDNDEVDQYRHLTRNCFKTEKEAQEHAENIETYYELKDLTEELNNGEEIDWEDNNQDKYFIYYDTYYEKIEQDEIWTDKQVRQIYCLDDDFMEKAIERIGEDRLIKLCKEM